MRRLVWTSGLLLHFAFVSFAQSSASTHTASQQLRNWLAAYDGSDWNSYLVFVQKNFVTPPEPMFQNSFFRDKTGGFDLKKIETATDVQVTAVVQERESDQMARFVLEVEATEPHRIVSLRPQPIPPTRLAEKELLARTREYVQELVSSDKFSGAVLIAKNGRPIFEHAYGLANRERHIPNALHTRFGTASMGKMLTAVAILQLVRAGKLKLEKPIGAYLTDYPNKEIASKVTIRQLLTHTGGTGDIFGPEFNRHRLELHTHEDLLHLFGTRPLRFEPGSRWEYSNYGFVILGAVIDRVSGQNYSDYVRDHIYTPALMTSTDSVPEDQHSSGRSVGYAKQGGSAWHPIINSGPIEGMGAGGAILTVEDLLHFANALRNNRLLDAGDTELLTTGHVVTPGGGQYAYGFEDRMVNGLRCFGHDGAGAGVSGDLKICPDAGYIVVVLANMDAPAAQRISNFVASHLPETPSAH